MGSRLRSSRDCRWGVSKAPNPQLLHGRRSINGCPLFRVCVHGVCVFTVCVCSRCVCVHGVCVCVHFGWVKCRAQVPNMGHHTWSNVMSLSLSNIICYIRSERLGNCWGKHWMCNIILDLCITLCLNIGLLFQCQSNNHSLLLIELLL